MNENTEVATREKVADHSEALAALKVQMDYTVRGIEEIKNCLTGKEGLFDRIRKVEQKQYAVVILGLFVWELVKSGALKLFGGDRH